MLGVYLHLMRLADGKPLLFMTVADICPSCGKPMESKRSGARPIVTLPGSAVMIVEEYYVCARCKDDKTGRRVIRHSEALRSVLPRNTKYGYDVEIEIGFLSYVDNKQVDEIKRLLEDSHGLSISLSQIHALGTRFLKHMVVVHCLSAPLLRKRFESGSVFHVDATCEAGRGMELTVKEGWTGIVLGAWKIPTENEDTIRHHLRSSVEMFGEPVAFVSDLGNGMMAAIAGVIQEMGLKSRQLVCHTHFLKAVGKSIMEGAYQTLRALIRKKKALVRLNRFIKETGAIIGSQAAAMREFVARWEKSGATLRIAGYMQSIAVLRAIAQWVVMFNRDCDGQGFPFALPHARMFDRCAYALRSISSCAENNSFDGEAFKYVNRLREILLSVVGSAELHKTVECLKDMEAIFTELRKVLRLEKSDVYKQERDKKSPDMIGVISRLEEETSGFRDMLCIRLDSSGVTDVEADAIRAVLGYFEKYGPFLFGHFFMAFDASGNANVKLIERSNNVMEHSYRDQKHQIRRRTGVKNLQFIFEHQLPAASMMGNLQNTIYQQLVLDNKPRGELIDLIAIHNDSMDYCDTPMYQDDLEEIGGRLPTADKRIVGTPGFSKVVSMLSDRCYLPQILREA